MNRKTTLIITVVLAVALIVCLVPWPIPCVQTLNAAKLDAAGKALGTVQIAVEGTKYTSVLLGDTLVATLGPIEEFPDAQIDSSKFRTSPFHPYLAQSFAIADTSYEGDLIDAIQNDGLTTNGYTFHLRLSPELDRWYIHIVHNNEAEAYYVASLSGDSTAAELYEYFNSRNP